MFSKEKLNSFFFFDIETCGQYANLQDHIDNTSETVLEIFEKKSNRLKYAGSWEGEPHHDYNKNVSLFPEFGRIACVSYGVWNDGDIKVKTIMEQDEKALLKQVSFLFQNVETRGRIPTGWNIKNFDIPWIARRLLMNGLPVPGCLNTYEKKPWDMKIFDMKDMWKNGSSLDVTFEEACFGMGIPSPKDEIEGKDVHEFFWNGFTETVMNYCEKDVKSMILLAEKIYKIYSEQ